MTSLFHKLALPLTLFFTLAITGCSGGGGGGTTTTTPPSPPPPIVISGTITSAVGSVALENAQVTLVNIETQQNEVDPIMSDVNGYYSFTVPPGSYEVRVAAQGYTSSPPDGVIGIPITQTATFDVALETITTGAAYGWLNLSLAGYSNSVGALVILTDGTNYYTGVTNIAGDLTMYNIPVGLPTAYDITIKTLGHETYTSLASVTFSDGVETLIDPTVDTDTIELTPITGFNVSGAVTFLAGANSEVDVSLTDPATGAVIPGTNVNTLNRNYTMSSVAPGIYYIRATYKIDGYVVDPDSIVKSGEPTVTVAAVDITDAHIDVTLAVILTSPIVPADGSPVVIDTLTPTLTWDTYPSTTDYVVEVLDANGNVVWGGFSPDTTLTKYVNPLAATLSVTYGVTTYGSTGPNVPLVDGKIYRWKIYASKNDTQEAIGWKLISASEEAQGVFKVVLP